MNILVVGSTGLLGTAVCKLAKAKGHSVAGLVRAGSAKEAELRQLGVDVRTGDLRDGASIEAACKGIDVVVATATAVVAGGSGNSLAAVDGEGYARLIEAAKKNSVKRFIYISASPNSPDAAPLVTYKRATEQALRQSGLKWTIIQPSYFMEVWFGPALGWDLKAGKAQIFGAGDGPISWISLEDVASYTVAVLDSPAAENQDIALGGPEDLTSSAALKVIEQTLGKTFKVTRLPGFVPKMASAVLKPLNPKLSSLMALGAQTLVGDVIDKKKQQSIAQVPLTSLQKYVQGVVK